MRFPAAICSDLRGVNFSLCIGHFYTENAKLSKILQDVYSNRSRNVVKSGWGYYEHLLHLIIILLNPILIFTPYNIRFIVCLTIYLTFAKIVLNILRYIFIHLF